MKIDEAVDLFREMPSRGLKPNVFTYSSLLHAWDISCRKMFLCKLKQLFDELQAAGLKPNFYTYCDCDLLDGLCANGHVEEALSSLNELEHKGEHLLIIYYNVIMMNSAMLRNSILVSYNILINETDVMKNGLLEAAKDILLKMEQDKLYCSRKSKEGQIR
ncbi:hypothetical protein ABFS82_06G086500 [Erythranthe guttata]